MPSESPYPSTSLTGEQAALWRRVAELWELAVSKDEQRIREALHPDYVGWDTNAPLPHDRDAAVRSVAGADGAITSYNLEPLSVRVYDGTVGIAHYRYEATVQSKDGKPMRVTGKWTEVYEKDGSGWRMIAVSGRPDAVDAAHGDAATAA